MKRLVLAAIAMITFAAPVAAQMHMGSTRPAQDRPGLLAFGAFDVLNMASSQTFEAVFGTSKMHALGAGIDVVNIWKHVFVRVAASQTSHDGERVVVVNSIAYKLGTKLTVDMTPTEIGAGWRFVSSRGDRRITPYIGAAGVLLSYKETSTFADAGEDVNETLKGFGAFGGVDLRIVRQLVVGGEAQYRVINSAPAAYSAAASFNEKNLGGAVFRLRVGLRF